MADKRGISGWNLARKANPYGAPLFVLEQAVSSADATMAIAPFAFRVLDMIVQCEATNASSTLKLQRGVAGTFTDVSSTLVCDTNHEFSSFANASGAGAPATVDDAQRDFDKGDTPKIVDTNTDSTGTVYLVCVKR